MDPGNRAFNTTWGLGITFSTLAVLAVVARFACRPRKERLYADDWFIIPALISAIGSCIVVWWGYYHANLGLVYPPKSPERIQPNTTNLYKAIYASSAILIGSLTFAKISVLLFYRRIFTTKSFRIPFYATLSIVIIWGVAYFVGFAAICVPVHDFWDRFTPLPPPNCIPNQFNESFAYTNVLVDLLVLSLPIPMVWGLQMSTSRKIGVLGIFMLGSIVLAIGIAKTVAYYALFHTLVTDQDPTYDDAGFFYWTIPESCLSVVAACLPTLSPLFKSRRLTSIVASVRSAISLGSVRSGRDRREGASTSGASKDDHSRRGLNLSSSENSRTGSMRDRVSDDASKEATVQEYEYSSKVDSGSRAAPPDGGITITHSFSTESQTRH